MFLCTLQDIYNHLWKVDNQKTNHFVLGESELMRYIYSNFISNMGKFPIKQLKNLIPMAQMSCLTLTGKCLLIIVYYLYAFYNYLALVKIVISVISAQAKIHLFPSLKSNTTCTLLLKQEN